MNFKYIKRYGLLALAIAAIHILATNYSNRSVPEDSPQVVLKKNASMYFVWNENDKTTIPLKAGDSLKVICSIDRHNDSLFYWAETQEGQRGIVLQSEIDNDLAVVSKKSDKIPGDTVVVGKEEGYHLYSVKTKEGKHYSIPQDDYTYLTANKLPSHARKYEMGAIHMTQSRFESLCTNKTPAELDEQWNLAEFVCHTDSGQLMRFQVAVLKDDGYFYRPVVTFSNDSMTSIAWGEPLSRHASNHLVLKYLPGSHLILAAGHKLIDGFYYESPFFYDSLPWYFKLLVNILRLVIVLIWLFCTHLLIPFIMISLIAMRKPLYFMTNEVLKWFSIIMFCVSIYVWFVLVSAYGFHWIVFMLLMALVLRIYWYPLLVKDVISKRCPHCRTLDNFLVSNTEVLFYSDYTQKASKVKETLMKKIITRTTVLKDSSGNVKDQSVSQFAEYTHLYQDYLDTYRIEKLEDTRKCRICDGEWKFRYEQTRLINREGIGTHIGTSSHSNK